MKLYLLQCCICTQAYVDIMHMKLDLFYINRNKVVHLVRDHSHIMPSEKVKEVLRNA